MSFRIALSGLNAASTQLDVTAHNIANVNTAGFKSSRALFADVFATSSNDLSATTSGAGVRTASITQQFSQGNIDFTNNNLDMAISGEGFFVMSGREGMVYSRAGAFSVDREGGVVNGDLQRLQVFPVTAGGNFATGSLTDLKLQTTESPPKASSKGDVGVNLPANASPPAVS
ncbi:MAG: flagellar hook-basal body complex protein, partial [Paraperlucidibaca sp.]